MTTAMEKKMRERLEEEHKRLTIELAKVQQSASTSEERREGSPFGKREEEATETLELEKRLVIENRIRMEIAAVAHALDKLEKGTYGVCENCGKIIDPGRLEVLPQAKYCMACKALLSKNAKAKPPTI